MQRLIGLALVLAVCLAVGWRAWSLLAPVEEGADGREDGGGPAPVQVAAIEFGAIEQRRTFSGTLEAAASFDVAAKVGGRLERLLADLADEIGNGQTVAILDSDEYTQDLAQAQADLAVAQANLVEATNAQTISDRTMQRQTTLRERGIASDAQFDTVQADQLAAQARLAVARAQVQRGEAAVETARIRLGYTQVAATWSRGDAQRIVAQRWVDEGDTVAANSPLLTVVEIDPIVAVLFVAERDYAAMTPGLSVSIHSNAYPDADFVGEVARVAPVFDSNSRQARVELTVPNPDYRLKPGMFVRAQVVLDRVQNATIVPEQAVARREDRPVVFLLDDATQTVKLVPVELGIIQGDRVQIISPDLAGHVVTLGQPLLDDGSAVRLGSPTDEAAPTPLTDRVSGADAP